MAMDLAVLCIPHWYIPSENDSFSICLLSILHIITIQDLGILEVDLRVLELDLRFRGGLGASPIGLENFRVGLEI